MKIQIICLLAGFIGSPKMNFISYKNYISKSNDSTEVDLMECLKLVFQKYQLHLLKVITVTLGIRPEHLLVNQDSDGSWESKVFVVEKLGSGTFLS